MSKLFRISGYFKQDENWGQIESSFVGKIVMGKVPIFWGYCIELDDGDTMKTGAVSYLAGGFLKRPDVEFYFYKMYDNPPDNSLLCMIKNLEEGRGAWATLDESGRNFIERNYAWLELEELPYSSVLEQRIYSVFSSCPALAGFPEMLAEEEAKICEK